MKSEAWNPLMSTCKQYEAFHIDYVCHLLDDARISELNAHLRDCANCRKEVKALKEVLKLTDKAETEISSTAWELKDVEMEVYRRLAAENEQASGSSLFLRVRHLLPFRFLMQTERFSLYGFRSTGVRQLWRGMLTGCALVVVLLISVVSFDGDQSTKMPVVKIDVSLSHEQLEQYRSQGIRRSLQDVLVSMHLTNDEWETAGRARMLNEQAQGTPYENITISSFR